MGLAFMGVDGLGFNVQGFRVLGSGFGSECPEAQLRCVNTAGILSVKYTVYFSRVRVRLSLRSGVLSRVP